ncbi:MAG: hypothetical protein ABSB67_00545 [Bryobacteraceae bacterium]|jgi:hypothetical protein
MKSLKLTCAALGLSVLSMMPLMADSYLNVNVPYPFVAGKVRLPAGAYTIQEEALTGIVTIRNSAGKAVVLLSGPGFGTAGSVSPGLTFVNVHGEMVLTSLQEEERPSRTLPAHGLAQ